jgi:hypothetical protein
MEEKNYPSGKDKTKPIRISEGLHEAIELFLGTDQARLLGFRYLSDVVNNAVRDLLLKYGILDVLEEIDEGRHE